MDSNSQTTIRMPARSASRLYGFDALRAVAAVLVVMLHAAHAYIPQQMPGLIWPAHDARPSAIVDGVFWWIEGFIMPLFLFMSGYFAFGLLQRLSPVEFVRHRQRRIALPMLFGCIVILPLDLYAWVIGLALDGRVPWQKLRSLNFEPAISEHLWGLSHLWYLQYVFLYCLLLLAGWTLLKRLRLTATSRSVMSRIALATLPALSAAILYIQPEVVIGFQHTFLPVPTKFAYSGMFFLAGAVLCGMPHLREKLQRAAIPMLMVSVPLAVLMTRLTHDWFIDGFDETTAIRYATTTAGFAWLTVAGLTGLFLRIDRPIGARVSYIAAASFWIYLLHHPTVGLLQGLFGLTSLPALVKFCLVTGISLTICLVTYELLVKDTLLGQLLNGRKSRSHTTREKLQTPEQKLQRAS